MPPGVRSGHVTNQLPRKDPGNVNLARWLTTANRILRLYISTETPSETLILLVEFIMNVYIPTWFDIKINWKAKDGAINQYRMITRVRELKDHTSREIASRVIQRNAHFCHPENVLIAIICDQNPVLRQLGWKKIQKARQSAPNPARSESFRVFTIPNINFKANAYNEMIDWPSSTIDYADPPMVRIVSNDQVDEWAKSNAPPIYPLGISLAIAKQ